ncbi:unnamed protein product [Heterobilharzia americana]|nr:unnamed protein product [Heterobilharzia americana]
MILNAFQPLFAKCCLFNYSQSVNKNHWFEEIFMNEKPYIPLWLISPFYYFQQTYLSVFFRLLKELLRQ